MKYQCPECNGKSIETTCTGYIDCKDMNRAKCNCGWIGRAWECKIKEPVDLQLEKEVEWLRSLISDAAYDEITTGKPSSLRNLFGSQVAMSTQSSTSQMLNALIKQYASERVSSNK